MAGAIINITDAGRAALINGDHTGTVARKIMQVGFAGAAFGFDPAMQLLPHEIKRVSTVSGENVAADTIHATIRDDSADQFSLYGFGLYLDNGVLLGTYCQATPIMEKSPVAILLLAVDMVFKQLDVTALTFGDTNFSNPPATTERQGVVELATDQETQDGADAQRAVTPAGLSARTATDSRTGIVQLATEAEVLAGKDNAKAVTPKTLAGQLAKKAEVAGAKTQAFSVATATVAQHAVPLGQADERFATPASVKDAKDTATDALATAKAALPRSGGDMTGIIDMTGPSNELRFTDTQQPITLGRFRMVSNSRQLIFDRNMAVNGDFSQFKRLFTVDANGNAVAAGAVSGSYVSTQTNINLPAHNNDGKGFIEFGGDTVIWRLFMVGPTGNLVLNSYNVDGTNRHQPFYIDYGSGRFGFASRPIFNGATPYDTHNLVNPLTAEGGGLNANRGFIMSVGYGRSALTVSSNGTDSIGGAFIDWNGNRTPALQIDCPSNQAAYMGIRWTQWGMRHLAAIDAYAGGSDTSNPSIGFHIGRRMLAWSFNEASITRFDGNYVWGSWNFDPNSKANVGEVLRVDGTNEMSGPLRINNPRGAAGALQVTADLGGAWAEWNTTRKYPLQVDTPNHGAAYGGIRWTQWGVRHLAAIDAYAGNGDTTAPIIAMHVDGQPLAWTFSKNDIVRGAGGYVFGTWNFDPNSKAFAGATCQWNSSVVEFGSVPTGEWVGAADLPAPYVMVGLRNGFYQLYLRAVHLRNQ